MKLKKFRIKNFKSIADSGDCYLTDTITILAGKNESGKTSILEALEDFDTGTKLERGAKPIKSPEAIPEISITFIADKDTIQEVFTEIVSTQKAVANIELEIIKPFLIPILLEKKRSKTIFSARRKLKNSQINQG